MRDDQPDDILVLVEQSTDDLRAVLLHGETLHYRDIVPAAWAYADTRALHAEVERLRDRVTRLRNALGDVRGAATDELDHRDIDALCVTYLDFDDALSREQQS